MLIHLLYRYDLHILDYILKTSHTNLYSPLQVFNNFNQVFEIYL